MIRSTFILFTSIILLVGCEMDLDVFKEGEPIPVVYCLLDQEKTTQSLRLSRTYSSFEASEAPESSDSILFDTALEIVIEQVNGTTIEKRASFTPVDVKKDIGFFPVTEHWVYQSDMEILPNTTYRLIIYLNEYDKIIYSTCTTVALFEILNPAYPEVREINLQTRHNPSFYWTQSTNAGIYQMGFNLHYEEYIEEKVERKTEEIALNTIFILENSGHSFSQSINSNQFYIKLNEQLQSDPAILRRYISLDAFVLCGGEELAYLVRLQTEGQSFSLMEYSNLQNGIGIFSSRLTRQSKGYKLTDQSLDSLAYGKYTHDLNFLDRNGVREEGGGL